MSVLKEGDLSFIQRLFQIVFHTYGDKHHLSLAFGITWENEQTESCYAHTSSVHQLTCILLLLRQVPSVQACVEPGAKSSTDYVMLRLFICLQANCGSRAVKLFAISIYQMAWNKTSPNKAI